MACENRELDGLAAIVTGGSGTRGRDISLALADAGASVLVNARSSRDAAEAVVAEIEERGGRAVANLSDITVPEEAEAMVNAAVDAFGGLDILVNSVGANGRGPVTELSFEDWRRGISAVLDGSFLSIKYAVPHLATGGKGSIINIGSSSAHVGAPNHCVTAAAKMGLNGMTGSLAVDLAPHGITVNCVALGFIERPEGSRGKHFGNREIPMGRGGKPEEITGLIRMLCGPEGRFISGQTIHVNGGWYVSVN